MKIILMSFILSIMGCSLNETNIDIDTVDVKNASLIISKDCEKDLSFKNYNIELEGFMIPGPNVTIVCKNIIIEVVTLTINDSHNYNHYFPGIEIKDIKNNLNLFNFQANDFDKLSHIIQNKIKNSNQYDKDYHKLTYLKKSNKLKKELLVKLEKLNAIKKQETINALTNKYKNNKL